MGTKTRAIFWKVKMSKFLAVDRKSKRKGGKGRRAARYRASSDRERSRRSEDIAMNLNVLMMAMD